MKVFIPKETGSGEHRVAATPETVKKLIKAGLEVEVEAGAGESAALTDDQFEKVDAAIVTDLGAAWSTADAVFKVAPPTLEEAASMKEGATLVAFLAPHRNQDVVQRLAAGKVSTLAMELVPRITRAQSMDALSSQASIAGYKAVLLAASRLDKYFPLLMTAAGTIPPARVVIMGAGVAGLQAIATAKRLGAIVEVSDIREVVKEQVESLGGRFIELPMAESGEGEGGYAREMGEEFLRKQREIVTTHLRHADVAITTALIPGKPAPRLLTREMVEQMRPGAVIVDLAVENGGNCELSEADREVRHGGVIILGPSNLPSDTPRDASMLFARNVFELVKPFVKDGVIALDPEDEVIAGTLLTRGGEVVHAPTAALLSGANA